MVEYFQSLTQEMNTNMVNLKYALCDRARETIEIQRVDTFVNLQYWCLKSDKNKFGIVYICLINI